QSIINLANPTILDEGAWIGQQKSYPTLNPPWELVVYRDSHLEIPKDWARSLLPDNNLTVEGLLTKILVKGTHAL
ncbi:hypothetical protein K443DRAFT_45781, partial [Laccaria amethystina LaAM-08-1]